MHKRIDTEIKKEMFKQFKIKVLMASLMSKCVANGRTCGKRVYGIKAMYYISRYPFTDNLYLVVSPTGVETEITDLDEAVKLFNEM